MMPPDDLSKIDNLRAPLSAADDPEQEARRQRILERLFDKNPQIKEKLNRQAREEGREEGRAEGRAAMSAAMRAALRQVLASQQMVLREHDDTRIQACSDFPTLKRWFERAFTARSLAEVFE